MVKKVMNKQEHCFLLFLLLATHVTSKSFSFVSFKHESSGLILRRETQLKQIAPLKIAYDHKIHFTANMKTNKKSVTSHVPRQSSFSWEHGENLISFHLKREMILTQRVNSDAGGRKNDRQKTEISAVGIFLSKALA